MFARVLSQAAAMVCANFIHTSASVLADAWVLGALVDILFAVLPIEGGWAVTQVVRLKGSTGATVGTWVRRTWVSLLTCLT